MLTATAASPPVSGGATRTKSTPRDSHELLSLLRDALRVECRFDTSHCDLKISDHLARVHGCVGSLAQKREVTRALTSVPGLSGVLNDVRIVPLSCHTDQQIAADVRAALGRAGLPSPLPEVKVVDCVVRLSGPVGSSQARKLAEDAAWSVPEVEYIVNEIRTNARPPRPNRLGEAEKLQRDIQLAQERSLRIEARSVTAEIRGQVVCLRGEVASECQRFLAESNIRWIPYVVNIVNELSVLEPLS